MTLLGIKNYDQLSTYYQQWVENILKKGKNIRESKYTGSIAVGNKEFILKTQKNLGIKAIGRNVFEKNGVSELKELQAPYGHAFLL